MRILGADGLIPRHPSVAKLFGSNDTEAMVRLITALLVQVLDPLSVLLRLALAPLNVAGRAIL